ncbi:hypothetical protein A2707_03155 [Candidatus Saccharibacteria bacterium RIFCSPHIGHO2_01_FULL_45_15]|nr:MAG: hypothetical protein A2707_03155 [Candidatus Saccharibacteria bacterium RIFCSPHIGHO2_01_FULL_45_15]OGL28464.1 MAG: hypothetical protein A3C39_02905 [Candidatus Saccharibacteria bacterium RIFCSPHIGHO2_02_FULL_46_12]OGL32501.1 MAG: hypothetical protein A3E76_00415 [Candidatus Saccharibacteria bacterium RIFCSPHIGHO2_12_FULL_44_22]
MSHILIIGQKFSSLTDFIVKNGHTYTLIQDVLKTKFPDKKFKNRVVADFTSQASLFEAIDTLKVTADAAVTTYESYVLPTAWVTEHLTIPNLPVAAAEACTDKFIMRSKFNDAPEKISPAFAIINSEHDVRLFAESHAFPLILKPANLAKSLLVTRNDSLDELLLNYKKSTKLLSSIYSKYAANRTPQLIIEEYLDGTIHSVDAFVDSTGTPQILDEVVDYQTGYDIGFDDNFHYSRILPSALSQADQDALRHCAAIGIRALGMKNSPAHVEVIMTREGPRIVEIGARNGGYRERMHSLANDIDITAAAINTALGKRVSIKAKKHDNCAVLELFPRSNGKFVTITNLKTVENLPSLQYLSVKAASRQTIGKSSDGYKMAAVVILSSPNTEQFKKDISYITENCQVIVD